jgi:hypothetical protein
MVKPLKKKRTQDKAKQPPAFTYCPICTICISTRALNKHLRKAHPYIESVVCCACGTRFAKDRYTEHIGSKHWHSLILTEKKLANITEEFRALYYVSSTEAKKLICLKCEKRISPSLLVEHVLDKHRDTHINSLFPAISHIFSKRPPLSSKQEVKDAKSTRGTATSLKNVRTSSFNNQQSPKPESSSSSNDIDFIDKKSRLDRARNRLLVNDRVPLRVCKVLIYRSAHWIQDKKKNKIVRAKAHFKNITHKPNGTAYISFGKMNFLVELAASKLIELVLLSTDSNAELKIDKDEFIYKARQIVSNSVETEGTICNGYHIRSNGFMLFGNQAIHVPTFIMTITDVFELKIHIPY